MMKTLTQLPDAKFIKLNKVLEVGKQYEVVGAFQDSCYIIKVAANDDKLMVLKSRFE